MNRRIKYVSIGLFFSSLLLLGLSRYRDYGISFDEPRQRLTGAVTVNYLAETFHTPAFMTWWELGIPPWLPIEIETMELLLRHRRLLWSIFSD